MELLIAISIGVLFAAALFQILRRNVIRSAMGMVILANAINLLLLTTGSTNGTEPSYVNGVVTGVLSDALPQAMVLTAIVISMGGVAFILAMLAIVSARYKTSDMDEVEGLKH